MALSLPKVSIVMSNGALGSVVPSADGCMGVILTGATVTGPPSFTLGTSCYIDKFADLATNYGITAANNPSIVKFFTDFYNHAPSGTRVWFMGLLNTITMTQMVTDATLTYAHKLRKDANGEIRGLFVSRNPAIVSTVANGFDPDVATAIITAQAMAANGETTPPIFCIIEGRDYTPAVGTVPDLTAMSYDRVGVMVGDIVATGSGTVLNNAALGILAGKLASSPVQRNVGRVKDGPIASTTAFIKDKSIEQADYLSLHQKGYITFRVITGKAGFYFCDDPLATLPTGDYCHLTARRTIDKVYRIAYATLVEELNNEVSVNDAGQVSISYAKSIENKVENAIINSMTVNGELGNDPQNQNDTGVVCLVDPTQNIISTSKLIVSLRVKPYGYARTIEINLGFQILT